MRTCFTLLAVLSTTLPFGATNPPNSEQANLAFDGPTVSVKLIDTNNWKVIHDATMALDSDGSFNSIRHGEITSEIPNEPNVIGLTVAGKLHGNLDDPSAVGLKLSLSEILRSSHAEDEVVFTRAYQIRKSIAKRTKLRVECGDDMLCEIQLD